MNVDRRSTEKKLRLKVCKEKQTEIEIGETGLPEATTCPRPFSAVIVLVLVSLAGLPA